MCEQTESETARFSERLAILYKDLQRNSEITIEEVTDPHLFALFVFELFQFLRTKGDINMQLYRQYFENIVSLDDDDSTALFQIANFLIGHEQLHGAAIVGNALIKDIKYVVKVGKLYYAGQDIIGPSFEVIYKFEHSSVFDRIALNIDFLTNPGNAGYTFIREDRSDAISFGCYHLVRTIINPSIQNIRSTYQIFKLISHSLSE